MLVCLWFFGPHYLVLTSTYNHFYTIQCHTEQFHHLENSPLNFTPCPPLSLRQVITVNNSHEEADMTRLFSYEPVIQTYSKKKSNNKCHQ